MAQESSVIIMTVSRQMIWFMVGCLPVMHKP